MAAAINQFEESNRMDSFDEEDSSSSDADNEPAAPANSGASGPDSKNNLKPMEWKKKRKALDKELHQKGPKRDLLSKKAKKLEGAPAKPPPLAPLVIGRNDLPELHIEVFRDLSAAESSVREAAAEALVRELVEVQSAYEKVGGNVKVDVGVAKLEAGDKDDGLENYAPSLRYALRRLIRGVSSSRECARQGFALALTAVLFKMPAIRLNSVLKLINELLEISSSMKGQEARESLLGRLFAYGALARSGRIAQEVKSDDSSYFKEFLSHIISLASRKRYLQEPAVSVILDIANNLPTKAIVKHVLDAQSMRDWFQKAISDKIPDALYFALKIKERVIVEHDALGDLLPHPFSPNSFFASDHLAFLAPFFQESTFCQPRVHSLWPVLINKLVSDVASPEEDVSVHTSSKKHKRAKKGSISEDITQNIRHFSEIVIEGSLLMSSHDRKHLAFDILLLLLPKLPSSCIDIVLSYKLVHCLMDILSVKGSWLYNAAQHFVKELVSWVGDDDDRLVAVIISLQKHSNGRFDCMSRTCTVKNMVAKFKNGPGCILFMQNLMNLFVEDGNLQDELSDQSQTTDENSEKGSIEDSTAMIGNADFLKNWVIDTLPRIAKNLKLSPEAKNQSSSNITKFLETKFRLQTEIMKFLAVQGLFSASLGTEITSFELQEKFKWPKTASSLSLCRTCIEQLQLVMEDAQRGEISPLVSNVNDSNDLGSYFIRFLNTLCNIPSVSLFRTLSNEDEKAFKKLQEVETRLFHEERAMTSGAFANKLHAFRYLLIQLLLQVLLRPGEFSEAASELVICCKKAFPEIVEGDSFDEEELDDDNDTPDMMDVLVDTLLSLLPQSTGPMCYSIEQVFRFFCIETTDNGLLRMLRVVKKDLQPLRHHASESDDSDEDDDEEFLGVEDAEDTSEIEAAETGDSDDHVDYIEKKVGLEADEDQDEEMDDEAMFRMDSYITQFLKKSGKSGNDTAASQLMLFKLRILSLLEIYLQKNPGKPQVITIYTYLARAYVNYHSAEGCKQLGERIGGILQKKIFKAKEYPKSSDIPISSLETLLEKSLKSASRARLKSVSLLAKNSAFWILKIIHSRNSAESELEGILKIFQDLLLDYFNNKKCRVKPDFIKEIIRRHPSVGHHLFGYMLEKCASAKSEFRRVEFLDVLDCVMKSCLSTMEMKTDKAALKKSKLLKRHLPMLCELIQQLVIKPPENKSRRAGIRKFCAKVLETISGLNLKKSFLKKLKPDVLASCESLLGDSFLAFKNQEP